MWKNFLSIVKVIGCNTAIMEKSFPETASCSEGGAGLVLHSSWLRIAFSIVWGCT